MSAKQTTTADGAHIWEFKARFRRHAFGWKSQPAIQRIKQAVSEIKKVARRDAVLAADGGVLFLERDLASDRERGQLVRSHRHGRQPRDRGGRPDHRCSARQRGDPQRLARTALGSSRERPDPYIERLADHWGELCASSEVASAWADRLLGITRMALSPDKTYGATFTARRLALPPSIAPNATTRSSKS